MLLLALLATASASALPPERLTIANRIAAEGKPECLSHALDGTTGPCLPEFGVVPGARVNARARGAAITFTQGAAARLTPDEFALLAGHEIAHYYLGHNGGSNPSNELAADRLGARLACQAGFDPTAGASLFRYMRAGTSHPRPELRRAAVLAVGCDNSLNSHNPSA